MRGPLRTCVCVASAFIALIGSVLIASAGGEVLAARTWHVSTSGSDSAAGTSSAPLRTISSAVSRAASGDTIEVRGGTYRESVQVYNKTLHIRSTSGQRATLDGSTSVGGFVASGGDWYASNWTTQFAQSTGDMVGSRREAAYPDQVFVDGAPLAQVLSRDAVVRGTFFHDTAADRIWIGTDPGGRLVEASNRSWAIYLNRANGSTLTNISVRRYATTEADLAAIRAHANNLTLTGVVSEYNAFNGVSMMGSNIVIKDGRFNDNGYIGVHGHLVNGVVVESSAVLRNNREQFDPRHSGSGMKFTNTTNIVVRRSDVSFNSGPGIWTDISSSGITVANNLVTDNLRSGIQIELSNNSTIAGNAAINNGEAGIWILESQNAAVWHNAVVDNEHEISVLEGPRRDVQNVSVRNNILGRSAPLRDSLPLLRVDDWTENRSAAQMTTSANHNAYWRAQTSVAPVAVRWARWPQSLLLTKSVPTSAGHDANSTERTGAGGLPVRDASSFDYRPNSSVPTGEALTAAVATALGLTAGQRLQIGPTAATPRNGSSTSSPGVPAPTPTTTPTTTPRPTPIAGPLTSVSQAADGWRPAVRQSRG